MASPTADSEKLLSVTDVARTLNVSERQVRRWVASGEIPAFKLGSRVRVAPSALRRFLKDQALDAATDMPSLPLS
jgi:excisionase family DNA binding protein